MSQDRLSTAPAAEFLGVSVIILRRQARAGKILAHQKLSGAAVDLN
jgi:hypothetical protein